MMVATTRTAWAKTRGGARVDSAAAAAGNLLPENPHHRHLSCCCCSSLSSNLLRLGSSFYFSMSSCLAVSRQAIRDDG